MRIALATCADLPPEFTDDELLAEALRRRGAEASFEVWDEPAVEWRSFDRVVIRSTWDYTQQRDEFLAWAEGLDGRLRNPAPLVRWNSDKRYLGELAAAGIPVVETAFVGPGDELGGLSGEVVVKPAVSAGGRDTGRFGPDTHADGRALVAAIQASGRTAMVQPFLPAVDSEGETALVFVAGEPAHVLRKRAVLRPDEVAPVRADGVGAAEAMYRPDLVSASEASVRERELAAAIVSEVGSRFGGAPLYARVDLLGGPDGDPVLLELEAVEPCLYLAEAPATAERLADALLAEL